MEVMWPVGSLGSGVQKPELMVLAGFRVEGCGQHCNQNPQPAEPEILNTTPKGRISFRV